MGLNDSYAQIRSQVLMMSHLPSVGQAFSIISQEESHRSLSVAEEPSTAFFSVQGKLANQKKDILTCDYCHWTGHTKDFCYKLVGYTPGHKLHKGNNSRKGGQNGRAYKDHSRTQRPYANLTDIAQIEPITQPITESFNAAAISVFTPAQYAEILKMLGTHQSPSVPEPVVNMAGPQDWEINGDW
ncbi:uncharacterized protein LOC142541504 [Primulina tabacum]|uniref:uncharacterized protein LOC142541504 n=1 Tax=Primulina tabacum TaxID=48773 RepID=UPI003F59C7A5